MLTQFVAAFDEIVIGRFNRDRQEQDRIKARYIYAPKQRVLQDLINENKTLTLPVVSVNVTGINRDENRVFNKLDGFYYQGNVGNEKVSRRIKAPVPINITLSVSVLTRYQTDMDQILSNFVPFCNPYIIISWKVPEAFNLSVEQEIRSEVLWTGDVSMQYPTDLASNQKARVTADTSFTIKGWLFKDTDNPDGNIFFIDNNFHNKTELENYDNYESLSGVNYTYPLSTGLINDMETVSVSGSPTVTDIFYNNVRLYDNLTLTQGTTGNVIINGYSFENLENLYLSSDKFDKLSADDIYINDHLQHFTGFTNNVNFSGYELSSYNVFGDNVLSFNLPLLSSTETLTADFTFVLSNSAGYDLTTDTLNSQTLSGNNTLLTFTFS